MEKIRVAINGFGRIGRAFFKLAQYKKDEIEIVAINDLSPVDNIAYLLKYDSAYGRAPFEVSSSPGVLKANGKEIKYLNEKDPSKLPWKDLNVDVVLESTGVFASYAKSKVHLDAGATRVVVSAPIKDEPQEGVVGVTVLMGVNDDKLRVCDISSNASCTTNAGGPVMKILEEGLGIEKALLNTIHGYTSSQTLVDSPNPKGRARAGRAGAQNIVPTTSGAAIATTKAVESLAGKFDGIALRVPVIVGSIVDITFVSKKPTTIEEVNEIFKKAAADPKWKGIFSVTDEDLVSSDIVGNTNASIIDLEYTRVVGGNLVKVLSWYDNEMGYANTLIKHIITTGNHAKRK
ncbi:MAG TPA: glyceraldehyde 3-phosphate dehydrogenase NAD-binding domain-containing protein [Candidatus Paceibacterota bacterium]|jgi:glyceraldehyde 3-phosphate dehydrogenase|nr:type I glyceraldehyde-3-phosphate dehydrogenase [Parcubacteria group bacterium]MDP6119728.1 glyceraldehyde 3-phosphate dehydrogenase NAD-binding domain-containing protein [Candidatus Paceibacterota bacterium]HJN62949.1 glyceraldehyde 3-phosphate dehydrogenase NAD-binding domain-containing protein [Candidatus Paceibacterota bacterium]|tara:strand:- start:10655 stop:11695 length:1041 start_codon:yes stop_codon:yes gene_type:complete